MPYYGFNLQWLYSTRAEPAGPDERVLDAVAAWGFNFVRLPLDYRLLGVDGDLYTPDERVRGLLDDVVAAVRQRDLHVSLCLHRAPGYIITGWETEPYNLFADAPAQDAFVHLWTSLAERYVGVPGSGLSFDLVNEPPAIGLRGFTRDAHEAVVRRTVAALRAVDPARPITIDGLDGGNLAMPELADLGLTQSVRGYQPMTVSHHEAAWWPGHVGMPRPTYPVSYDGR